MKYLYIVLMLLSAVGLSQNKQLLYNVDDLPQSLLLNPGTAVDFNMHIGVPFLSQLSVNYGSTGVDAFDVFEDSQNSTINSRITGLLDRISIDDYVEVNQQLEVFSFGWRNRNGIYFSGGLYQEVDNISYLPKNLAQLFYEGNANDNIGRPFNFNEVTSVGELLAVWHFGVNKKISKKTTIGARGKIYSSLVDIRSDDNSGIFITQETPEGPNILRHSLINADIQVQTSGLAELNNLPSGSGPSDVLKILRRRVFFGGNLGLGVDFGVTHKLRENLTLTASVIDFGFIRHTKDVETYSVEGSYDLDGLQLNFPEDDTEESPPYYQNLIDEVNDNVPLDTIRESYTTLRPVKFNTGLNFGFNRTPEDCNCYSYRNDNSYDNNAGLQLYAIKRPRGFQGAATAYFDKRISKGLRAKLTYTVDPFSATNIGLLMSTKIKAFNFYIAADNLLAYQNLAKANSLSLQLGFQFVFNKDR